MSLSVFNEHREHVSSLDNQSFLGSIVWWGVSSTRVSQSVVKNLLDEAGISVLCRAPADVDVFRRAFTNGVRRSHKSGDITENLLVRNVKSTSERIVKRIVQELVDSNGETLAFNELVDIRFSKNHPERVDIVELEYHQNATKLAYELRSEYMNERGCLDAEGVRNIIRRTLSTCKATAVRESGGVFFVMQEYADTLAALESLAAKIPGCLVHSLPLIDDRKQRSMIQQAFKSEAAEELDRILTEIDEVLAGGEVSERKFLGYQERVSALKAKAAEYSEILEEEVMMEGLRVDLLNDRVSKLFMMSLGGE